MIILILLYFSLGSSFALPSPSDLSTDIPLSFLTRNTDIFGTRSIWCIIWSCLPTLFACIWIAVHPNIPGPKDSCWVVLGRRMAIMGYILIAPEMVIWWAARQHSGARRLAKRYHRRGWTMTHGFFLIMGGFTLHDERGTALRILVPQELDTLLKAKEIAWPSITEEEIQDRSKGDFLSKTIVLVQTGWFITQCIVRGAYGLEVTELELATLAFATLTGVTYYLWWHKPLDVRCSVPVYMHPKKVHVTTQTTMWEESQTHDQFPVTTPDPKPNSREPNSTPIPTPNFTRIQRISAFIQRRRQKHGTFLGLIYVFLLHPLFAFLSTFDDMGACNTLDYSSPLRVPTFYAPIDNGLFEPLVATCVAVVFGGIHCIAWSFHFPSLQERSSWRNSAAFVFGSPVLLIALAFLIGYLNDSVEKRTKLRGFFEAVVALMWLAALAIYIVARITLLVLPCIALRALPPVAFVDIQWASFFPHIG